MPEDDGKGGKPYVSPEYATPVRIKEGDLKLQASASANRATEGQLVDIRKAVEEKVANYKPDDGEDDADTEFVGDTIDWS